MKHTFYHLEHIDYSYNQLLYTFISESKIRLMNSNIQSPNKKEKIYLSIDHLKKGQYELEILLNNKVIKTIKIIK